MKLSTLNLDSLGTTALLDPMTGTGLLVLPHPSSDVQYPGSDGMAAAAWNDALRALYRQGWEVATDEYDEPATEGYTACGRRVVGLYALAPIIGEPSLEEIGAAMAGLRAGAGLATNP